MLQRRDDPAFWQSVTGSLEAGETALLQAAAREVKEEVAIDVACKRLTLIDCQPRWSLRSFLICVIAMRREWSEIRNSGSVLRCLMSGKLPLPNIWPTAGSARSEAAALTKSWSNRQAIEEVGN